MIRSLNVVVRIALAAAVAAMAATPVIAIENPWTTVISCSFPIPYSNTLTAHVTQAGALFHYEYTLYFNESDGEPLTVFDVENPHNLWFTDVGNSHGFNNPEWGNPEHSDTSVLWQSGGSVPVGNIVTFWYDSPCAYTEVGVLLSGGFPSVGDTLGMMIPDPSSLATFAVGFAGIGVIASRKLRRSTKQE